MNSMITTKQQQEQREVERKFHLSISNMSIYLLTIILLKWADN